MALDLPISKSIIRLGRNKQLAARPFGTEVAAAAGNLADIPNKS
jgi:hypothetical protein